VLWKILIEPGDVGGESEEEEFEVEDHPEREKAKA